MSMNFGVTLSDLNESLIHSYETSTFRLFPSSSSEMWNNQSSLKNNNLSSIHNEYLFDRIEMKVIFITLYSIVFFFCFFGNLLVILVVIYSRRMRGMTHFFLANLAIADLCVGIFCIYQTLTNYIMESWLLGDFLCKVYMFVQALSYTASIMILVVVCVERYLAIIHPIKCRSMLTKGRLRAIVAMVWILATVYASPRFIYVETIYNELNSGAIDIICIPNFAKHNKKLLDSVNFLLLYLIPLILMSWLYSKIAIALWRSGDVFSGPGLVATSRNGRVQHVHASSRNILIARRGVIKMLIAVVAIFAICNLPQQIRILWIYMHSNHSDFDTILSVLTYLISYMNSCLNPILYAFLSRNFNQALRELFSCTARKQNHHLIGNTVRSSHLPHTSVGRLSSVHGSPCTITRQSKSS